MRRGRPPRSVRSWICGSAQYSTALLPVLVLLGRIAVDDKPASRHADRLGAGLPAQNRAGLFGVQRSVLLHGALDQLAGRQGIVRLPDDVFGDAFLADMNDTS